MSHYTAGELMKQLKRIAKSAPVYFEDAKGDRHTVTEAYPWYDHNGERRKSKGFVIEADVASVITDWKQTFEDKVPWTAT